MYVVVCENSKWNKIFHNKEEIRDYKIILSEMGYKSEVFPYPYDGQGKVNEI